MPLNFYLLKSNVYTNIMTYLDRLDNLDSVSISDVTVLSNRGESSAPFVC